MFILKYFRVPIILLAYVRARYLSRTLSTRRKLENFQNRNILRHLRFLRRHSAYYRQYLRQPTLAAWNDLPLVSKKEMMEHFDDINTRGVAREKALSVAMEAERSRSFEPTVNGVTVGLSSGTSGHRGLFMAAPLEQWRYAGTVLAKVLPGFWRQQNRVAFFLRANSNLYTAVRSRKLRFEYFDLLIPVDKHLERLQATQPTLLIAPPSLLRQLAERAQAGQLKIQPEKIISVAEVLDPVDEEFISGIFGQRLHQIYQATEGFLAATCSRGVLHLNEDLLFVEKEWLDLERRKFVPVITDFSRKTQPIVRYRLNDVLTERAAPCACGSPMTALEFIEGRSDDLFQMSSVDGTRLVTIYPDFVRRAILLASDKITDYRVQQIGARTLRVAFRAQPGADVDQVRQAIEREFKELSNKLGFNIDKIEFSTEVQDVPEGKKLRRIENQWHH